MKFTAMMSTRLLKPEFTWKVITEWIEFQYVEPPDFKNIEQPTQFEDLDHFKAKPEG